MDFDWDDANRRHVLDHLVKPAEAEHALLDPRRIGAPAYAVRGEPRWAVLGATEDSRVPVVVFTRRHSRVRVITARDASAREKRRYRRKGA